MKNTKNTFNRLTALLFVLDMQSKEVKNAQESAYVFLTKMLTDKEGKADAKMIYALAYMVAYSTYKKAIKAGSKGTTDKGKEKHENVMNVMSKVKDMTELQIQVLAFSKYIERIERENADKPHKYNEWSVTIDYKALEKGEYKLKRRKVTKYNDISPENDFTTDKGSDLVQSIVLAILESIKAQRDKGQTIDFESTYTYKTLDRKIYVEYDRPTPENVVEKTTTPIQQIYRIASRHIRGERKVIAMTNFEYIKAKYKDFECYLRTRKNVEKVVDFDRLTALAEKVCKECEFTNTQKSYLTDRLNGLTLTAIGKKYSVDKATVRRQFQRMQTKYNTAMNTKYGTDIQTDPVDPFIPYSYTKHIPENALTVAEKIKRIDITTFVSDPTPFTFATKCISIIDPVDPDPVDSDPVDPDPFDYIKTPKGGYWIKTR